MRLVDSALWLPCHSEPVCNTEFIVENLTPGSSYRFRVAAINRAGIGEPVELPQTVQLGKWICALRLASFVMAFALFLLIYLRFTMYKSLKYVCLFCHYYTEPTTPPLISSGKMLFI